MVLRRNILIGGGVGLATLGTAGWAGWRNKGTLSDQAAAAARLRTALSASSLPFPVPSALTAP